MSYLEAADRADIFVPHAFAEQTEAASASPRVAACWWRSAPPRAMARRCTWSCTARAPESSATRTCTCPPATPTPRLLACGTR
jgi:hypothetical protein